MLNTTKVVPRMKSEWSDSDTYVLNGKVYYWRSMALARDYAEGFQCSCGKGLANHEENKCKYSNKAQ
jgi:hypothetical protein